MDNSRTELVFDTVCKKHTIFDKLTGLLRIPYITNP